MFYNFVVHTKEIYILTRSFLNLICLLFKFNLTNWLFLLLLFLFSIRVVDMEVCGARTTHRFVTFLQKIIFTLFALALFSLFNNNYYY